VTCAHCLAYRLLQSGRPDQALLHRRRQQSASRTGGRERARGDDEGGPELVARPVTGEDRVVPSRRQMQRYRHLDSGTSDARCRDDVNLLALPAGQASDFRRGEGRQRGARAAVDQGDLEGLPTGQWTVVCHNGSAVLPPTGRGQLREEFRPRATRSLELPTGENNFELAGDEGGCGSGGRGRHRTMLGEPKLSRQPWSAECG
jgi:hypothetical protein